jgi:uncharacterized membrane protein YfcA
MTDVLLENDFESTIDVVESIPMDNIGELPSERLRKRLNSVSSVTSTSSGISVRHGRVYNNRPKKKVPDVHKVYMLLLIAVLFVAIPWFIYGMSRGDLNGQFRRTADEEDEFEHNKEVDWSGRDIAGFIVASVLIMVAAGGGIGGGGVLVPTYIFVLGFEPKYAIPLSNCTILGSSISNLILNVNKRHPFADRPLIDWDMILMMEPLTIAGALVGTFINVLLPPWVITVMLVILLVLTARKTLNKGIKKYKQESAVLEAKAAHEGRASPNDIKMSNHYKPLSQEEKRDPETATKGEFVQRNAESVLAWNTLEVKAWWQNSLPPGCQEYIHIVDECELDGADLIDLDYISLAQFDVKKMLIMKILRRIKQLKRSLGIPEEMNGDASAGMTGDKKEMEPGSEDPRMTKAKQDTNHQLIEILKTEMVHPTWKVMLLFALTIAMLTLTVLKGGGHINVLDIHCGQALYWGLTLTTLPVVLTVCWIARNHLLKVYYAKQECGYEYLENDVKWDERNTIRYPLLCSIAGLCAGMFGIGGGIVKGPLMLEMNVLPQVTSATSATMILMTSAGASISYLLFQQLNLHYGLFLFVLGMIFTMAGQLTLNAIVKRYNRASLIILVIGITVAASAVAMGIESSGAVIDLFNGNAEGGGSLCGAKGGE